MSIGDVFELSRPRWPDTQRPEPVRRSFVRSACLLLATAYASAGLLAEYALAQVFAPVQWALGALTGKGLGQRRWAWAGSVAASAACVALASRGDAVAALGGLGPAPSAALVVALGYALLGAFRWSSLRLMARESAYDSYEAMLAELDGGPTGWFIKQLRRPADVLWLRQMAVSTLVHLPPTASLVGWGASSWFARCWFVVAILATVKTAGANHNIGHSRPFARLGKSRWGRAAGRGASLWYHYVVELLEGDVPHLTISGHNLVHHVENNGPGDFESTYPYDRTSFVSTSLLYFNCMLSYSFGVGILPYLWRKRDRRQYRAAFRESVAGLAYTYGALVAIGLTAGAGVALLVLCTRLVQSGLRYGPAAYLSHAFVDPDDPTNSFSNSIEFATRGTLMHGGGVHALHHERAGRHWTTLKVDRRKFERSYASQATVMFPLEVLPFVQPLLFGKRFDVLARWTLGADDVVRYEDDPEARPWSPRPPDDRLVRLLERRSRPGAWEPPGRLVSAVDAFAARALLRATGAHAIAGEGPARAP